MSEHIIYREIVACCGKETALEITHAYMDLVTLLAEPESYLDVPGS